MINSGQTTTDNPVVTLTLNASDIGSGVAQMQISNVGDRWPAPEAYNSTRSWTLNGNGVQTVYVRFQDKAGNWSRVYSSTIELLGETRTR